ncbi:hypothetical protein LCGC14_0890690 [marine sediment metagenome]|uniref:Uncharacterized protein n=1 Tax=marine sediment metagenome TaxID=412755 RepID=A0A0F9PK77_9ZZZZ
MVELLGTILIGGGLFAFGFWIGVIVIVGILSKGG